MGEAEQRWFHCTAHAYAAWLPGDGRGSRTRDHREHVEGDYKNPPAPRQYEGLHRHCQNSLTQQPATFPAELRRTIAR